MSLRAAVGWVEQAGIVVGLRSRLTGLQDPPSICDLDPPYKPARRPRRGVAVFVVLLLLSMALALSYVMMRSQSVTVQIQRNAARGPAARQDALTGVMMAIKKMSTTAWAGVGSTLSGSLGPNDSFQVTFTTGDPSLAPSSSNYSDYPYRVTVLSTGHSIDPQNSQCVTGYQVQAVVRLVPRALAAEPSQWSTMLGYTVYQNQFGFFDAAVPSQIQGPVYTQATLDMSHSIWASDGGPLDQCRQRYYADLNPLRLAQGNDWRPYTAQIQVESWIQYSDTISNLTNLGIPVSQYWSWTSPSYQLYTGGKTYNVPSAGPTVQNTALGPDVLANPLGFYYSAGQITLANSATLSGTLITSYAAGANVSLSGTGIQLNAFSLPALYGTTTPIQFPVLVSGGSVTVAASASVAINGQAAVVGTFDVASASQTATAMTLTGQLITGALDIEPRSEFLVQNGQGSWWNGRYNAFISQTQNGYKYFPQFLQAKNNMDPTSRLIIKPAATAVRYHWQTWNGSQNASNPIFVPATGDAGLYWDIVGWTETPGG